MTSCPLRGGVQKRRTRGFLKPGSKKLRLLYNAAVKRAKGPRGGKEIEAAMDVGQGSEGGEGGKSRISKLGELPRERYHEGGGLRIKIVFEVRQEGRGGTRGKPKS